MLELPFYNTFFKTTHPPVIALLPKKLAELTPPHINQVFYGSSGSESNDTAIRLIRHYWVLKGEPSRRVIISRKQAYHGSTIAAGSMGGMSTCTSTATRSMKASATSWTRTGTAKARTARAWRSSVSALPRRWRTRSSQSDPENVAAFAAEPVQGAGGVKIAPSTYWPAVQKIIDKYGILFLADEVITGFGRLGTWFALRVLWDQAQPHHLRQGATIRLPPALGPSGRRQDRGSLMSHNDDFNHGYTFAGHPVACAVALANLEIMEQEKLVPRVKSTADQPSPRCSRRSSRTTRSSARCVLSACSAQSSWSP